MDSWKTAACIALMSATTAVAQSTSPRSGSVFPVKPIRLIVTTPGGSGGDFFARTTGQGLTEIYKQQIVVENRPGAGGLIGAGAVGPSSRCPAP